MAGPASTDESLDSQYAATEVNRPHPGVTLPPPSKLAEGVVPLPSPDATPRYEIQGRLGRGGMGHVERAHDRRMRRPVATKTLHATLSRDPTAVARFVDEIRTVGSLDHPNIVPIHDVGVRGDGRLFFVMKLVDGETLESLIRRLAAGDRKAHASYPPRRRLEIFAALLRALAYAHAHGTMHRDVKPANIMIGRFGEVVLMDWGIAKPYDSDEQLGLSNAGTGSFHSTERSNRATQTAADSMVGTPMYMSPEQTMGNALVDPRSDLYAACLVLHQLLALRHRFEHHTEVEPLVHAIRKTDPPPARRMFRDAPSQADPIPYEITHYLRRGMARDPDERWQSADEMLVELDRILEGRCRIECPTTLLKRLSTGLVALVDERPAWAIALAFGLLATFVALLFI